MPRPSDDDLELAAEWLAEYESEPERTRLAKVAEWLRAEVERSQREAFVRRAVCEVGCSRAQALGRWAELRGRS